MIALLGLADRADACRYNATIPEKIAKGQFDTVVLTEVVDAVDDPKGATEERGWSGTAKVKAALRGSSSAPTVEIGRSGASSMCDDGTRKPAKGDRWVVYLSTHTGGWREHSYPLAVALQADPNLARDLRALKLSD